MFVRMFTELFHINHEEKILNFQYLVPREQYSFIQQVRTMREIKRVSISLVPSNLIMQIFGEIQTRDCKTII